MSAHTKKPNGHWHHFDFLLCGRNTARGGGRRYGIGGTDIKEAGSATEA